MLGREKADDDDYVDICFQRHACILPVNAAKRQHLM